jgi:hypothetical protein
MFAFEEYEKYVKTMKNFDLFSQMDDENGKSWS